MFTLLVVSVLVASVSGAVLQDCENRVEGADTLLGGGRTYIYMKAAHGAAIKFVNYEGGIPLKIVIDCNKGIIKATSKPVRTWKKLAQGSTHCVAGEDLLVVVMGKQVFVNNELIALYMPSLKLKDINGGLTVSVNGKNTVEKIAMGNCIEYPTSTTTCEEANQFYQEHVAISGGALIKDGFLQSDYQPVCDGAEFGSYQLTQSHEIMCSTKDGQYLEETRAAIQKISGAEFVKKCDDLVGQIFRPDNA